ncbi:transcription factor AP-1 [Trichinella spiralis]|uniref:transcription factor AP-1 n=1 Tax=Trichinella spiralis TaxID=6334 RepID=UPI0001EFD16E|nr:transcription factor AP-1 [Trichinella spiralis]
MSVEESAGRYASSDQADGDASNSVSKAGPNQDGPNRPERKRSLTLDFGDSKCVRKKLDTQDVLQLLGLSSPDLERFFTQGVAVVSNTPTPTQFFYPKNVTAEQEQYARGFIDALNQIHQMRGFVPMSNMLSPGFVSNTVAQADIEETKRNETRKSTVQTFPQSPPHQNAWCCLISLFCVVVVVIF